MCSFSWHKHKTQNTHALAGEPCAGSLFISNHYNINTIFFYKTTATRKPYKNIVILRKVRVGTEILLHARLRYVQYFLDARVCTLLCSRCVATIYYNAETRKGGVGQNWRGTRMFLTGLRSAPGQRPPEKAEGFLWPLRPLSSDGCC